MDWIVFRLKGEVIQKISLEGYAVGELQATKELLAYENECKINDIKVEVESYE